MNITDEEVWLRVYAATYADKNTYDGERTAEAVKEFRKRFPLPSFKNSDMIPG